MKKYIPFIFSLLFLDAVHAQQLEFGTQAALSRTNMNFSSDYQMEEEIDTRAILGGNLGGSLIIRYKKYSIRNFLGLQFTNYKYLPELLYFDNNGQSIGASERKIRNLSLQFTPVFSYDFKNGIFIGTGASVSFLLKSQYYNYGLTVDGSSTVDFKWINNNQYRKFSLAIPLVLGMEWKRNSIFLCYSYGLSNRNFKEAFITERENNLVLGYNLVVGKKSKNSD